MPLSDMFNTILLYEIILSLVSIHKAKHLTTADFLLHLNMFAYGLIINLLYNSCILMQKYEPHSFQPKTRDSF